jgi:hypothetical protein
MAFDPVANARIELELNDDALVQGIQRVEREHSRAMREIDRSKAESTIDLDTAPFEDKVIKAKRRLKQLEKEKAELPIHANTSDVDSKIKHVRRQIKRLDGEKATIEMQVKGEQKVHQASRRIEQATLKRVKAIEDAEAKRQKLYEQAEKRRMDGVRAETRVSAALNRQREREMASAHTAALRLNREMDAARVARQRDLQSIPKLQREYADLTVKMEQLAAARRKAFPDKRSQLIVDL